MITLANLSDDNEISLRCNASDLISLYEELSHYHRLLSTMFDEEKSILIKEEVIAPRMKDVSLNLSEIKAVSNDIQSIIESRKNISDTSAI